jgi:adenylate cyclase class 2
MLEVEMKFPAPNFAALESRLAEWQARPDPPRDDADTYFRPPDRDFARTDEAFRMRRTGSANRATYKGPKVDAQTKTRTEIEVPLADGDAVAADFERLLKHLRYQPVATVRKRRRVFHLNRGGFALEVCLDEVVDVGRFVELEIQADESHLEAARRVLLDTAAALGLPAPERRSYLELLLSRPS